MKFQDIKVGDVVYVRKEVKVSMWDRRGRDFWIPCAVERTTTKQFIVDGKRYKKEDGRLIGKYFCEAHRLGEDLGAGKKFRTRQKRCGIFKDYWLCETRYRASLKNYCIFPMITQRLKRFTRRWLKLTSLWGKGNENKILPGNNL